MNESKKKEAVIKIPTDCEEVISVSQGMPTEKEVNEKLKREKENVNFNAIPAAEEEQSYSNPYPNFPVNPNRLTVRAMLDRENNN